MSSKPSKPVSPRFAALPAARARLALVALGQLLVCLSIALNSSRSLAQDRSVCFFPLPAAPEAATTDLSPSDFGQLPSAGLALPVDRAWEKYLLLWSSHHRSPEQPAVRRFLGLPGRLAVQPTAARGRTAPSWLGWRSGTYLQLETPHFSIYSQAPAAFSRAVAEDAERFYWIWTQLFFPFWEGSSAVDRALEALVTAAQASVPEQPTPDRPAPEQRVTIERLAAHLTAQPPLRSARPRMRIVIFRNAAQYRAILGRDQPGVAQSTGFYSDERQTTFLFGSDEVDLPTRYHEFTHQLFREASLSRLGSESPGAERDFWLVEGIAGYMESLAILGRVATVGGWDAERLQYARYRVLVGGDSMPIDELRPEGRLAIQKRADLARWYAHAIAHTHALMDGDEAGSRPWLFHTLARLYRIEAAIPEPGELGPDQQRLKRFLTVTDAVLAANANVLPPRLLCLAACEVTPAGLSQIPPSNRLTWLDLARLPVSLAEVQQVCTDPSSLTSLNLEATRVDPTLVAWLSAATQLQELDLSWTATDDSLGDALPRLNRLETLWLTGTRVSDQVIDAVIALPKLRSLDLQRTGVTETGLSRLQSSRPALGLNPLEIR